MEQSNRTEAWQSVLAGFDSVWARVSSSAPPPLPAPREEAVCLAELAAGAARAAAYDRALAVCFRVEGRAILLRHREKAAKRAARLRGELFLREGVCAQESGSCPRLGNPLPALREGMLRDRASAESYARAAEADRTLRDLLTCFAEEARAAAEEKRELILRCFR